jgi:hypothetical protein
LTRHGLENGFGPGGVKFFHSGITMDLELFSNKDIFNLIKDIAIPSAAILIPIFTGYITAKIQARRDVELTKELGRIQKIKDITTDYISHANKCYCYTFSGKGFEAGLEKSEMLGCTQRFILEMNPAIEREKNLIGIINEFNDEFVFVQNIRIDVGRLWEKSREIVNAVNTYITKKPKTSFMETLKGKITRKAV